MAVDCDEPEGLLFQCGVGGTSPFNPASATPPMLPDAYGIDLRDKAGVRGICGSFFTRLVNDKKWPVPLGGDTGE
jgi:hypothetical protein